MKLNTLFAIFIAAAIVFLAASCSDDGGNGVTPPVTMQPGDTTPTTPPVDDSVALKTTGDSVLLAAFTSSANIVADPGFTLDLTSITGIVPTGDVSNTFTAPGCQATTYKGAVDPSGTPWYQTDTWSYYAHILAGIPDKARTQGATLDTINAAEFDGLGDTVRFVNTTTYFLDGFVFVNDGQVLEIQEGTVIKGLPGQGEDASALVVARGGQIFANGTSANPIIFTYAADGLDGSNTTGGTEVSGEWGGLIVLGNASLNSTPGETPIEGIPTTEPRGVYGGSDDMDNSGVLRYVSIRHGGTDIGAGNEINGLTLGGVGSGTTIEFVEVIANEDDGIEWFGGTVGSTNIITAFCRDDSFDYDEGYRGVNQFCIIHQNPAAGDRGGEHDGGTDPETGTPFATPTFCNVTSIGRGTNRAITFRDNAGGFYYNSIFVNFGRGVDIEAFTDGSQSSYTQFQDGNLIIQENIFSNVVSDSLVVTVIRN